MTLPLVCLSSEASTRRSISTGKERDSESGNDYFGARYYASSMGRWLSPDWSAKEEPVPYAKLDDPQTLNLYAYVQNNPLTNVDKDGHCAEAISCTLEFAGGGSFFGPVGTVVGAVVGAGVGIGITYFVGKAIVNQVHQSANSSEKGSSQQPAPSDAKPGTKGKPDHQQTVKEEAEKIGGQPEVRIPTPGGAKETRVGDAVATDASGKVTAVTQVIRPTPAGNVPLREQKAAQDIENATGVKPKLVPVRPLPQQPQQ
jgi:RHS repeat-associated protein